jgi:hypothetical protein
MVMELDITDGLIAIDSGSPHFLPAIAKAV